MIKMISQYSQNQKNVTSFKTLELFTQHILHQRIYSISPLVDVSKDSHSMSICMQNILLSREIMEYNKEEEEEAKFDQFLDDWLLF